MGVGGVWGVMGDCPHRLIGNIAGQDHQSVQVDDPATALYVSFVALERKLNVCADMRCCRRVINLN